MQRQGTGNVPGFTLWLQVEQWVAEQWNPADDYTDAIVALDDGSRWVATFCAFAHVDTLRARLAETGECLGSRYLWLSDLILIADTSRASVSGRVASQDGAHVFDLSNGLAAHAGELIDRETSR